MNKFNQSDQAMDEVQQNDPTKFQTNKKDCCSNVLFVYLCLMFLALIAVIITSIIAVSQNTDWREGRIFGEIMIPISFLLALCYLYYIYQLNQFYKPRLIEESYFLDMNQKFSTSFCSTQEQIKFLPIHYLFLILPIFIEIEQQECQPNVVKSCPPYPLIDQTPYQKSPDPGLLTGWLLFSIIFMRIIILQEIVIIIWYAVTRCKNQLFQYPKIYKQAYQNRIKIQAKICLTLFLLYSIFKIILYIVVVSEYHNQSSIVLITSNIYYHLIMISIVFRTLHLIRQSENIHNDYLYSCVANLQDNFYDYMTFIIQIFQKDKINKLLFILSYLTITYIIVGIILYNPEQKIFNYVSTEAFINFDCVAAQLFSVSCLIFMFVIHPYFGPFICSKCYKEENLMQRETSIHPSIQVEEKLYTHITELNQNVTSCVICLLQLKFMDNNSLVRMNCHQNHIFHQECIDQWLKSHNNCPICLRPAIFIGN